MKGKLKWIFVAVGFVLTYLGVTNLSFGNNGMLFSVGVGLICIFVGFGADSIVREIGNLMKNREITDEERARLDEIRREARAKREGEIEAENRERKRRGKW